MERKGTILIADQDAVWSGSMARLLGPEGYAVVGAHHAVDALFQARMRRPDLILLDLNMPRKDGRKALKEIKADPHLRTTPVVILTTSQEDEDILQSYETGASSFITKPVTFRGLLDLARTLGSYWLETVKLPPQKAERRN